MITKQCSLKQRRNSSANKTADVDNKFTSKNIHRKLLSQAWAKNTVTHMFVQRCCSLGGSFDGHPKFLILGVVACAIRSL